MGCGGSTVFSEDGSVLPGKGESKIEWDASKPVSVGFFYHTKSDAKCMVKEFPMDKDCVEKKFCDDFTDSGASGDGMHWIKVVPGTRYAMKYVEGGHSVAFPGQAVLDIPRKLHEHHTKDDAAKDKLAADLKKEVSRDKEHPYSKDDGLDAAKAHIDQMNGYGSCADMPEEWVVYKKACLTVEELQPWNTLNALSDIRTEYGYWEEKDGKTVRVMGLSDKAKKMAEEKVAEKGPEIPHKAISTAQKVFKGVIEGAVKGACKKAGPEVDVLAPTLAARIDNMDHCNPGVDRVDGRKQEADEAKPDEKKEEEGDEDPTVKAAREAYEAEKSQIDAIKKAAAKDRRGDVAEYLKSFAAAADTTIDPSSAGSDAVMATVGGFQVPAFVKSVDGDKVNVTYPKNLLQDEADATIPKEDTGSIIEHGKANEIQRDAFHKIAPPAHEFLDVGRWVTVRNGREFYNAFVKSVDGDDVILEDGLKCPRKASKSDVWPHINVQQVAAQGVALVPEVVPLQFRWTAEANPEISERKVCVWRVGAKEETYEECDLKPIMAKAKPTKADENPTHEVHTGYGATMDLLRGRKYAVKYVINGESWLDFDTKATSDSCFKIFTCNARVEY